MSTSCNVKKTYLPWRASQLSYKLKEDHFFLLLCKNNNNLIIYQGYKNVSDFTEVVKLEVSRKGILSVWRIAGMPG